MFKIEGTRVLYIDDEQTMVDWIHYGQVETILLHTEDDEKYVYQCSIWDEESNSYVPNTEITEQYYSGVTYPVVNGLFEVQKDTSSLDEEKDTKVALSKEALQQWLEDNPIQSTVHDSEGAYYSITLEKQTLLTQAILSAQIDIQQGITPEVTWNSTQGVCEPWELEDLISLSREIRDVVQPRIKKQQQYEISIMGCSSKEEVNAIEFDYDNI